LKEEVLKILKKGRPGFVSGEEICQKLNVTRAAVWKHIQSLREDGYLIEARPRAGYILRSVPDRLYPWEIADGLDTAVLGREIYYYPSLTSTNDVAKDLARSGSGEGTLIVAEEQTGGKGRLGRFWHSPPRLGLLFSLILRPAVEPRVVAQVTMVAAVALACAIKETSGLTCGIKWPNDLLAGGRKLGGILTELSAEVDRVSFLVLGAGINVNQSEGDFPPSISATATSLKIETGRRVDRVELLKASLREMERWYNTWLTGGFAPVLARWKELCVSLNRPVAVHSPLGVTQGWAEDVDEDGALVLRTAGGEIKKFVSGEVSLRS